MEERDALDALEGAGNRLLAALRSDLAAWLTQRAGSVLDAWSAYGDVPSGTSDEVGAAAVAASDRVLEELAEFLALDAADQRATPLQIVRGVHVDVTAVLAGAGVPPVEREAFAEEAFPDDHYGLAPDSFADLGEHLQAIHLEWGAAKAALHLARRRP